MASSDPKNVTLFTLSMAEKYAALEKILAHRPLSQPSYERRSLQPFIDEIIDPTPSIELSLYALRDAIKALPQVKRVKTSSALYRNGREFFIFSFDITTTPDRYTFVNQINHPAHTVIDAADPISSSLFETKLHVSLFIDINNGSISTYAASEVVLAAGSCDELQESVFRPAARFDALPTSPQDAFHRYSPLEHQHLLAHANHLLPAHQVAALNQLTLFRNPTNTRQFCDELGLPYPIPLSKCFMAIYRHRQRLHTGDGSALSVDLIKAAVACLCQLASYLDKDDKNRFYHIVLAQEADSNTTLPGYVPAPASVPAPAPAPLHTPAPNLEGRPL